MPKLGLKISFQKRPTTTGESIIGIRISVVTKPLPRKRSRSSSAKPKPRIVCRPTERKAKRPVVAKYFHNLCVVEDVGVVCKADPDRRFLGNGRIVGKAQIEAVEERKDIEQNQQDQRGRNKEPLDGAVAQLSLVAIAGWTASCWQGTWRFLI